MVIIITKDFDVRTRHSCSGQSLRKAEEENEREKAYSQLQRILDFRLPFLIRSCSCRHSPEVLGTCIITRRLAMQLRNGLR